MILPRARTLVLSTAIVARVAMVGVATQRELMPGVTRLPVSDPKAGPEQKALTVAEESYAEALWPIHSEVVARSQ